MIRVMFVCHGNICRSPMAEYVLEDMIKKNGLEGVVEVASAATSREEIGNDMYPPACRKLREKGIPFASRAARQVTAEDYRYYDHLICMDRSNIRLLNYITGGDTQGKVSRLMQWAGEDRDVADPWYTGDFEATYRDVLAGCTAFLKSRQKK